MKCEERLAEDAGMEVPVDTDEMFMLMVSHALLCADIIDRMEWALENVVSRRGKRND